MDANSPRFKTLGWALALTGISLAAVFGCGTDGTFGVAPPSDTGSKESNDPLGPTPTPAPGSNRGPVANDIHFVGRADAPVTVTLKGTGGAGNLVFRVVSAPVYGQIAKTGNDVTVTPLVGYSGLDAFTYVASDGTSESQPATVSLYYVDKNPMSAFWLRNEDIMPSGKDGSPITNWRDAVAGTSATFVDGNKTPRYKADFSNGRPGVTFQFATGDGANNDYMYYNSRYVYAPQSGVTFFAVARSIVYSSSIAPVLSFGDWLTEGYGFSWNTVSAGVGTPVSFGGADSRSALTPVPDQGPSVFTAQIVFADQNKANGMQRARFNGGSWATGASNLLLKKLTAAEIDEGKTPTSEGSPIMIGANNDAQFQPDRRFSGQLGEILLIDKALGDAEIKTIENYLKAKFGLQ